MAELSDMLSGEAVGYVEQLSPAVRKKYGMDFGELLKEPANFADTPKILDKISSVKADVDAFFDGKIAAMGSEKAELDKDLGMIDADSKKIIQTITTKASIAQVPFIKPVFVDMQEKEEIIIDGYSASVDQLVTRMINISDYIADLSATYENYIVGSWLFSGKNRYVISISPPVSEILVINRARDEINGLLESISQQFVK